MRLALAAFLLTLAGTAVVGAGPARAASAALVQAIDVSVSVSSGRYMLQHDGIARAFESLGLIKENGEVPGGIEPLIAEADREALRRRAEEIEVRRAARPAREAASYRFGRAA